MSANAKIINGELIITIPINEYVSATGKSLVIASTNGNKVTDNALTHKGKAVFIGVNAYIPIDQKTGK